MKKVFVLLMMQMCFFTSMAQRNNLYREDLKERIGLDYSMPDFNTTKINSNVIGIRLSKILTYIDENSSDFSISSLFVILLREVDPRFQYAKIEKITIKNIRKQGNEIAITVDLKLKKNPQGIRKKDIEMKFIDGVSNRSIENDLFVYASSYIRN